MIVTIIVDTSLLSSSALVDSFAQGCNARHLTKPDILEHVSKKAGDEIAVVVINSSGMMRIVSSAIVRKLIGPNLVCLVHQPMTADVCFDTVLEHTDTLINHLAEVVNLSGNDK